MEFKEDKTYMVGLSNKGYLGIWEQDKNGDYTGNSVVCEDRDEINLMLIHYFDKFKPQTGYCGVANENGGGYVIGGNCNSIPDLIQQLENTISELKSDYKTALKKRFTVINGGR